MAAESGLNVGAGVELYKVDVGLGDSVWGRALFLDGEQFGANSF